MECVSSFDRIPNRIDGLHHRVHMLPQEFAIQQIHHVKQAAWHEKALINTFREPAHNVDQKAQKVFPWIIPK
jgi:hypothetical protein